MAWKSPFWVQSESNLLMTTQTEMTLVSQSVQYSFYILPKRPYLPCISMTGSALLAGYPGYNNTAISQETDNTFPIACACGPCFKWFLNGSFCLLRQFLLKNKMPMCPNYNLVVGVRVPCFISDNIAPVMSTSLIILGQDILQSMDFLHAKPWIPVVRN